MVCAFVCVSRRELNILATGKGLIAGDLTLQFENGARINGFDFSKGFLVPDSLIYCSNIRTNARYVLVIEKDAIFKKLIDVQFHLRENAILIASKGFPDVYTREIVNILCERYKIKTFGLFDCDPFGIDIYFCFKFGSSNLVHHNYKISSPNIIWLGIYPTEITFLKMASFKFTMFDRERLRSLMERCYIHVDPLIYNELHHLQEINVKSGIQDLNESLFSYIRNKIEPYLNDTSTFQREQDNIQSEIDPFISIF